MKIRKIFILILCQYCFQFMVFGQDSILIHSKHFIGIYSGYSSHIIRDEVASPLKYRGVTAPIVFTYNYVGISSRQTFTLFYDKLEIKSSITNKSGFYTHFADNYNALLSYSYNKKAFSIKSVNSNCFLGLKLLSILNYRDFYYYKGYNLPFAEQLNSIGINLMIEKKIGIDKENYFQFNLNLPFVSYSLLNNRYNAVVSESFNKYYKSDNLYWEILKNGKIISINKLVSFQTELSYKYFISKRIGIELQQQLHFYNFYQYKNLIHSRYLGNQFLLGLIIKL